MSKPSGARNPDPIKVAVREETHWTMGLWMESKAEKDRAPRARWHREKGAPSFFSQNLPLVSCISG
ncbi:MAG: hypothetical protein COS92_07970 [Desulfobacterales bacterium CG07_land_8_20_14_0_80_52_14]|nr:MAG: hypothetical protein COS92_07970 [Desulfobacterales bacterium CG07_land_8_20_14_0_80_52_14]